MKTIYSCLVVLLIFTSWVRAESASSIPGLEKIMGEAFGSRKGALVLVDCDSGAAGRFGPEICTEKLAPCSTFKIWNTLIGLETGVLTTADAPFYKWDGKKRMFPDWNKDLTLKEAFRVSCVPAYQELARKIGVERMKTWIGRIGYGDRNISSGLDVFWLPDLGRKTLLISPEEQAQLMVGLAEGKVPFSKNSQAVLKEVMTAKKTEWGTLYGKTGSGLDEAGKSNMGWFVGYVESGGRRYAFASLLTEKGAMGKDARAVVERVFEELKML